MTADRIVAELLSHREYWTARQLLEATVRLPPRGHKWIAVYTGVEPGKQVWKSTHLTDRDAALAQARAWEAEARRRRAQSGLKPRLANIRVRPEVGIATPDPSQPRPLSQREIAVVLRISERAVRVIERRALAKLRRHPLLRQLWAELTTGKASEQPDVEESRGAELTSEEVAAQK